MSQNDICLFPNNITLSIHARSPLFSGAQTGLCSSPLHLPGLAFFWAPEFSFLNAALPLSFTLLILDPFYFIRAALNSSFICESAAQTSPASCCWKSFWSQDTPPPQHTLTGPVTLPEKKIQLVWHNLLFPNPWQLFSLPLCSQSHWLIVNNSTLMVLSFHWLFYHCPCGLSLLF